MKKSKLINSILVAIFFLFILISYFTGFDKGVATGKAFLDVLVQMLKILPCAFILIGLFDVWVKRETVMRHLGYDCGLRGYFWILLLAGFSVGGLYVAFPLAETLYKKGASLKVIFVYLGFVGIFRIPMTIFEISFLGLSFTLVRLLVTVPLFFLAGIFFGEILSKRGYSLQGSEKGTDIQDRK